jgi:hypothetical protein
LPYTVPIPFDMLMRPTKFVKGVSQSAGFSVNFSAHPTGIYQDASTTVAILSVQSLPLLSPDTFQVNAVEGSHPNYDYHYGGSTYLTMPDGESGTLTANWQLSQAAVVGTVGGDVSYSSSGASKPFLGANKIQIKVVLQLLRGLLPVGSYYEWKASALAGIPNLPPDVEPMFKSGIAVSGANLTIILDVTMNPPRASFTASLT